MLYKTRGIVLKTTKYSESSLIAHVFTEKFGFQGYLLNGARSTKGKIRAGMLHPLSLLDMVVYHKTKDGLQRASELRNEPVITSIPFDVVKSAVGMFVAEVSYRAVRQQGPDEKLFDFLFNSVQLLDLQEKGLSNFHLAFLTQLSKYLGFYPAVPDGNDVYFDLKSGTFSKYAPLHPLHLPKNLSLHLVALMNSTYDEVADIMISNEERRLLLDKMVEYYGIQMEGFGQIRSHEVLKEVMIDNRH